MNNNKKKILIKSTSSLGDSMSSNAEYHTLFYFAKWLSKDSNIIVSGIEYRTSLITKLTELNVLVRKPILNYLRFKKYKGFTGKRNQCAL